MIKLALAITCYFFLSLILFRGHFTNLLWCDNLFFSVISSIQSYSNRMVDFSLEKSQQNRTNQLYKFGVLF